MTTVTCCAYNCGNKYGREGVTFHRFPLDKPNLLAKWLMAMGKPKWLPTKDYFVCNEHFTDDMFNQKGGYRFVKYDAVPTKFYALPKPKMLFPSEYQYRFLTVREVEEDFSKGYVIEAKLAIEEEDKFYDWLKRHEDLSKVKYRMVQKQSKSGKNLAFKSEYVCRNSALSNQPSCPAKLLVRIRSQNQKFSKPQELEPSNYSCTVVLYHLHNHRLESNVIDVSNFVTETVSEDIKEKFIQMFKGGYSPQAALTMHQNNLYEEYPDEYEEVLSDSYICPNLDWLEQLHSTFRNEFGEWNEAKGIALLESEIAKINTDEGKAKMQKVENDIVIALCTPLMQRAHSLKSSGEIVFSDSSGFLDSCKCYVYVLMAYSCSEGLPLGVLVSTSDSENVLTIGFQLLADVLPEKAFGQYGRLGPEVFLTANNDAEQKSIKATFPDSTLLLCSFSLLKTLWRWLWDVNNNIEEDDRCMLFTLMHEIMKTKNAEEFKERYDATLQNETVMKYPNFQEQFKEVSNLSERWAVRFKNEIVDRDKEISAVEMASLVLKDQVYFTKAYNIPQMLHFLAYDLETYFKQKINHCINNTLDKFYQSSFRPEMKVVDDLEVILLSTGQYKCHSTKSQKSYFVDMETCVCSCPLGLIGSRCKHQYAVCMSRKTDLQGLVLEDDTIKKELHWIATNSLNSLFGTMERESHDSDVAYDPMDDEEYDPRRELQPQKKLGRPKTTKKPPTPKEEAKAILDRVVKDIIQRYETSPMEYHRAIVAMAVNYQSLHYDVPIMAALRNFGKNLN